MKFLLPIAWIYAAVMAVRNRLFDWGILPQRRFPLPVISTGNLAVGGTGKTPHTEYLLRLLSGTCRCAVLSRGYGRKTKGYCDVPPGSHPHDAGDEPCQVARKFAGAHVAVCESRREGIVRLLASPFRPEVILLDDAYQHRYVKPGLSILLTDCSRLYSDDLVMPAGRLRESRHGAKRADIIVVTKCPATLSREEQEAIRRKLRPEAHQHLFFSRMAYGNAYKLGGAPPSPASGGQAGAPAPTLRGLRLLLVCGIARPRPLVDHLRAQGARVTLARFADHHRFTDSELQGLARQAREADIVVTTEKDAARLSGRALPPELAGKLYVQPIEVEFLDQSEQLFNKIITDYVTENKRDSTVD